MADFKETNLDYLDVDNFAVFSSSEKKWINKLMKLKERYPDEVDIRKTPEENFGELVAYIPKSWFKISPPRKTNYTDEQRAAMGERMRMMVKNRRNSDENEDEDF